MDILGEIVGTMQGLWGVLSNYQVDVDSIQKWWEEQYGNLMENGGWGESGAAIIPVLLELFSSFMPATTAAVETTIA